MPTREPSRHSCARRLTRIEEDRAGRVLDEEGVDWQRLLAPDVEEVATGTSLAGLSANVTRDEADDAH